MKSTRTPLQVAGALETLPPEAPPPKPASSPLKQTYALRLRTPSALLAIEAWPFCSITLILYNKFVLHTMNFRFPLFVTMLHCLGVSASLHVASSWFHLFEPPQNSGSFQTLLKKMVPVSIMFASATVMRNYAFISLPISTMQMINSSSPALAYVFSCTARLDKFSYKMAAAVSGISAGVCLSAASTMRLTTSAVGAALLFGGLILEVARGILLKMLLLNSSADSVGPMGLLYLSSTMSFLFLAGPVALTEAKQVFSVLRSSPLPLLPLLAGNVFFAICLNFASFNFLNTCSVTTTSITAVLKDCALFFVSLVVLQGGTFVSHVGLAGYALSIMSTLTYILMRRQGTLSSASEEGADGHKNPLNSSSEAPRREKV